MKYWIHEDNMERLVKKLSVIANKCRKYNTEFKFEITGEEQLRKNKDDLGHVSYVRYVEVEAEGIAKIADWEFVATIQHNEPMNIVRCFLQDVEVPHEYFTAKPFCDHCQTRRYRKDTYIIRNTKTGEFKQVGKSCLLDYTHGLSAEAVAQYISWFDEIIKGEAPMPGYKSYSETKAILQYAVEAVQLYGYVKSDADYGDTTKSVVRDCYHRSFSWKKYYEDGFDPDHEGNEEKTQKILAWAATLSDDYGYKSSLKAILAKEYCEPRDYGFIVSAVAAYDREVEKIQRQKKEAESSKSEWVGSVGDRINIEASLKLLTSWDSDFGYTYLYKLTDKAGNVFTWKTGKWLSSEDEIKEDARISLKGTIKAHNEYKGIKQTELTRCKVL